MAQFSGRRGTGWAWVILALLLVVAAVVIYLAVAQPEALYFLQPQPVAGR